MANKYLPMVGSLLPLWFASACAVEPPPTPWRYECVGGTDWTPAGSNVWQAQLHTAEARVDLASAETRIEVVIANPATASAAVELRVGPAGAAPRTAIGELLLRPLGALPGTGGPDMVPYNSLQPVVLQPGWQARFFLDEPLGRAPSLGQQFVLMVEARDAAAVLVRRSLPVRARLAR